MTDLYNPNRRIYDLNARERAGISGRQDRFWLCWVSGTTGGGHFRHYSLESAQNEAERLARLPDVGGQRVYMLECIGNCRIENMPLVWEVTR